jgi:hypothetical protein
MEPNKLETQFREKLNAREIQPSPQAWDRLDAMLSVAEEKKTKRPFGFLFIAASILVLVTAGMFFFNQKSIEVIPTNSVVVQEKDTVNSSSTKFQTPIIEEKQQKQVAISFESGTINKQEEKKINPSIISQKTNNNQNQIIKDKAIEFQNTEDIALKNLPKIQDITPIVVNNDANKKADELLVAKLENTSFATSSKNSKVKVNAQSLLSQVDGELDQSFRETKLERIQRNFKTVKEALVNRNNQE